MFRWTVLVNGGPKGSYCAATAVKHEVYSFQMKHYIPDNRTEIYTDVFNTVSLRWRKLAPVATGRSGALMGEFLEGHTAVPIEYIVYIWGGSRWPGPYCNVLYAFDVDADRLFKPRVSGTVPEGRGYHSACVLGKVMFIHGGHTQHSRYTNDTYRLDTTTMVWSLINTRGSPPPASEGHSATIIGTKMFVFGGPGGQCYNYIRVFDTETNFWLNTPSALPPPGGRKFHSAFAYNGELYIIGGENGEYVLSVFWSSGRLRIWKFNPETFSWTKVGSKGKPFYSKCCMVGDRLILFWRYEFDQNKPNQLYILDLSPSLKTLCKLAVIQYGVEQSELPHNIRWELGAMTTNSNRTGVFDEDL